jgi:hypothetical protein
MALRPAVIGDQYRIDVRLTGEAEYRIPFTFIEALNEGTLFDRPAEAFLDAARERRLFHVLNRTRPTTLLALASFKDPVMRNRRRKRRLVG